MQEGSCSGITPSGRGRKGVGKSPNGRLQRPVRPWLPEAQGGCPSVSLRDNPPGSSLLPAFPPGPVSLPGPSRVFPGITVQIKCVHLGPLLRASVQAEANQEKWWTGARPTGRLRSLSFSEATSKHRGERWEVGEPACLHTSWCRSLYREWIWGKWVEDERGNWKTVVVSLVGENGNVERSGEVEMT